MVRLPPFFALRALEAAARHRSYSRAGQELSVTHGAISQQIRRLEAELGARLFERRGREMVPTPDALKLAQAVARSLDDLATAITAFESAAERDALVVSLDSQFANRWLPARLPRLLADPAGAGLDLRVEDGLANFVTDGVDVGVRYGAGGWPGLEDSRLFLEQLLPVCSPEFQLGHSIQTPADLLKLPLLHNGHRPWSLWFEAFGLEAPEPAGMVFNDSTMLLEAAAEGLGLALARDAMAERDLQSGRLVAPLSERVPSEFGFWVVWRADSRKLRRIRALCDWLAREATASA